VGGVCESPHSEDASTVASIVYADRPPDASPGIA
jgi:hypothetical protein